MKEAGHCAAGFVAAAGGAHLAGLPAWQVAVSGALGAIIGPGADADQHRWWHFLDKVIPDGGLMGHRGITHWVGWPVLAAWWLTTHGTMVPSGWAWVAWAEILGWSSHLAADLVFGKAWGPRGRGVPLLPGGCYVGLGLDSDGFLSVKIATPLLIAGSAWILADAAGLAAPLGHAVRAALG